MANSIEGKPFKVPICVAFNASSLWMAGMTGGIARIVRRKATPTSHSSTSAVKGAAREGLAGCWLIFAKRSGGKYREGLSVSKFLTSRELLAPRSNRHVKTRSEEHTSELQ